MTLRGGARGLGGGGDSLYRADITITLAAPTYPEFRGPDDGLSICHMILMTWTQVLSSPRFPNEETEAQSSEGTCSRPHNY